MPMNRNDILELCRTNPPAVADLVLQLQATVTAQQEQIVTLTARVAALEARQKTDSHNSSKPPASDPPAHKPVSLRKPSGRNPGGQAGHSGRTLTLSATPDVVVTHTPAHCADCHAALSALPAAGVQRRQVLDVPPLKLLVTEHQSEHKVCPHCGHRTQAAFPTTGSQPVQYGPRVQALGVYLLTYQLLPLQRASELLGDLFGTTFGAAALYAAQQRAAAGLQAAYEQIAHAVQQAPVAHFDESGLRVNGKLHWLHVAGTSGFTHYSVQAQRGKSGMNQAGILTAFAGTAVHDGWGSYFAYGCRHALCNAHHLRELTGVYEAAPHAQAWALGMQTLLRDGKHAVEAAQQQGATCLPQETLVDLTARYTTLVQQG